MNIQEVETLFLSGLAAKSVHGVQTQKLADGELVVLIDSPCLEVGHIQARVHDEEITLTCRITHTHSNAGYFKSNGSVNPQAAMIDDAVGKFADFVQGRSIVQTEIGFDGQVVSHGWRRLDQAVESNPSYKLLVEKMHGGRSTIQAWSWEGKVEGVEIDY